MQDEHSSNPVIIQPIGRILSRTGRSYLHLLNRVLKALDLKRNYYALIIIESGNGLITQNELANELETDKVSVVRIIDYLASKGYVKRMRSKTDKRKYCLLLTEKAQAALPGIRSAMKEINSSAFSGLTAKQQSDFLVTLSFIRENLNKASNSGI
jgi:DNA-binding MarR family transcriptional regulator